MLTSATAAESLGKSQVTGQEIALFYHITGLPKAKPRVRAVPAIGYSNFNRNIPWQVPISQRPSTSIPTGNIADTQVCTPIPSVYGAGSAGPSNQN